MSIQQSLYPAPKPKTKQFRQSVPKKALQHLVKTHSGPKDSPQTWFKAITTLICQYSQKHETWSTVLAKLGKTPVNAEADFLEVQNTIYTTFRDMCLFVATQGAKCVYPKTLMIAKRAVRYHNDAVATQDIRYDLPEEVAGVWELFTPSQREQLIMQWVALGDIIVFYAQRPDRVDRLVQLWGNLKANAQHIAYWELVDQELRGMEVLLK